MIRVLKTQVGRPDHQKSARVEASTVWESERAKENVGFVGTGRMGSRMVRRLIQAGHEVTIYDTSEAAVAPLVEIGAKRAASPAAVASAAEIVFASVPTPPIVQAVTLGPSG